MIYSVLLKRAMHAMQYIYKNLLPPSHSPTYPRSGPFVVISSPQCDQRVQLLRLGYKLPPPYSGSEASVAVSPSLPTAAVSGNVQGKERLLIITLKKFTFNYICYYKNCEFKRTNVKY